MLNSIQKAFVVTVLDILLAECVSMFSTDQVEYIYSEEQNVLQKVKTINFLLENVNLIIFKQVDTEAELQMRHQYGNEVSSNFILKKALMTFKIFCSNRLSSGLISKHSQSCHWMKH